MKSIGNLNLEGSSTLGRLGLKSVFDFLVLKLYSILDRFFGLEVRREFFHRVLWFSSITRLGIILCLHLSSLTLYTLPLLFIVYAYALK